MEFKDFLVKVYDAVGEKHWLCETFLDPATHEPPKKDDDYAYNYRYSRRNLTFESRWTLGGTQGSCWDTSSEDKVIVEPEMEPTFTALDEVLEAVAPNITFIQYKAISNEVMERGTYHESDYYGGSTTEAYTGFNIKKLYDALEKRGLLKEEPADLL